HAVRAAGPEDRGAKQRGGEDRERGAARSLRHFEIVLASGVALFDVHGFCVFIQRGMCVRGRRGCGGTCWRGGLRVRLIGRRTRSGGGGGEGGADLGPTLAAIA